MKNQHHYGHFWFQKRPFKVEVFLHIHQKFAIFCHFSSFAAHLALFTLKNHQILQKNVEKKRKNIPIITTIKSKWPLLENSHSELHFFRFQTTVPAGQADGQNYASPILFPLRLYREGREGRGDQEVKMNLCSFEGC